MINLIVHQEAIHHNSALFQIAQDKELISTTKQHAMSVLSLIT